MTHPTPISPIAPSTTFPHTTSPAVATQTPSVDTSVPAINAYPVELDGVPTSPQAQELKRLDGDMDAGVLREGAGKVGREVG